MIETGHKIVETGVVTRVAEAAITFADGVEYAPVIEGTSADYIKQATDSATSVVGFVKKPTCADSIEANDVCSVVIDGLIKVKANGAVTINSPVEVHSVVTEVAALTYSAIGDLSKCAGIAKSSQAATGSLWLLVGRR